MRLWAAKFSRGIVLGLLLIAGADVKAQALTTQGSEQTVPYSPPVANLTSGPTPATNFNFIANCLTSSCGPGANTFLLTVNPTVSARISITNETANSCLGSFIIYVAASAQSSSSYNTQLQQWSSIALISPTQGFVSSVAVDLPALTTIYIATAAISARNVAIQIVNAQGICATTTIDATVTLTNVAVTSPLISNTNGTLSGGVTGNVQGVIPSGNNGFPVFPVETGVLQPPTNATTAVLGVDAASASNANTVTGQTGTFILGAPPPPAKGTETGYAFFGPIGTGGAASGPVAPWVCVTAFSACGTGNNPGLWSIPNVSVTNRITFNLGNGAPSNQTTTTLFEDIGGGTVRQGASGSGASPVFPSNTLAGSTILAYISLHCSTPCTPAVASLTDTQGNIYSLVTSNILGRRLSPNFSDGLFAYATGPSTAAADTLTFALPAGMTVDLSGMIEISSPVPVNLNQALIGTQADGQGNTAVGAGTFNTTTGDSGTFTITFNGATQTNRAARGAIITVQLGTVSGTTPTLAVQPQWSPDGGLTFLNYGPALPNLTTTGQTGTIIIYPTNTSTAGATPAAFTLGSTVNVQSNAALPRTWRLVYTIGGTTPSFAVNAVQVNYVN